MKIIAVTDKGFIVKGESGDYLVSLEPPISCECRDYVCRHRPNETYCKHIKWLLKEVENVKLRQKNNRKC